MDKLQAPGMSTMLGRPAPAPLPAPDRATILGGRPKAARGTRDFTPAEKAAILDAIKRKRDSNKIELLGDQ